MCFVLHSLLIVDHFRYGNESPRTFSPEDRFSMQNSARAHSDFNGSSYRPLAPVPRSPPAAPRIDRIPSEHLADLLPSQQGYETEPRGAHYFVDGVAQPLVASWPRGVSEAGGRPPALSLADKPRLASGPGGPRRRPRSWPSRPPGPDRCPFPHSRCAARCLRAVQVSSLLEPT